VPIPELRIEPIDAPNRLTYRIAIRVRHMAKSYSQVIKQIDALQREAESLRRKEIEGVVDRIKDAIRVYGLSASDLGLTGARKTAATKQAPVRRAGRKKTRPGATVKFRDENGNVWGGRGPRPAWLRTALASGRALSDFAV
jgi:DNA-binding protein H-NS